MWPSLTRHACMQVLERRSRIPNLQGKLASMSSLGSKIPCRHGVCYLPVTLGKSSMWPPRWVLPREATFVTLDDLTGDHTGQGMRRK